VAEFVTADGGALQMECSIEPVWTQRKLTDFGTSRKDGVKVKRDPRTHVRERAAWTEYIP
jgi:hypothetical protein